MKSLILTIVLSFFMVSAFSQEGDGEILIQKRKYIQYDQKLNNKQLGAILSNNPASVDEWNMWNKKYKTGMPFMYAGVGLVCVGAFLGFGASLSGSSAGLGIMVAGLGIEIVGAVIIIPARKNHLHPSIHQYNASLAGAAQNPVRLNLVLCENGLGLRLTF